MKFPNPAIGLPQWRWLQRFDRWRLEHGILTGCWTPAEIDEQHRRAHQHWLDLQRHFDG